MRHIKARTLDDAWYRLNRLIIEEGTEFIVGKGSETTETKKVAATVEVTQPGAGPLAHPEAPTGEEMIHQYMEKLFTPRTQDESYTYGQRIREPVDQLEEIIDRLTEEPMDRQCTVVIRRPDDINIDDPPCLTIIDVEVLDGELNWTVYFRSWDAYAGFPENMAGLYLMQKWMSDQIGVETGSLTGVSKNLHIYKRCYGSAEELGGEVPPSFSERMEK